MTPDPGHAGSEPAHSRTPDRLTTQALRSLLWSALSFGSSKLVLFGMTLVLARLLAPSDFGLVAAGLTLIALLEIALDLGIGAAVVYEQESGLTDRVRSAFTLNLAVASVLAFCGVLSAPAVAAFFRAPAATELFQVLFLYLVLRGASQVQTAVLQRDLRYRDRTVVDVTRAVVRGAVSVGLALAGAGAWAIVLGLLAGELVGLALTIAYVPLLPAVKLQRSVVGTLLRFGAAVLGIKVVTALLTKSDNLIVGHRLGPEDLGLYSIAFRLPELSIDTVHWIFSSVAFAVYSRARAQGLAAFREGMLRALRLTTLFGFSAGAGLAIAAPLAVPLLFSDVWTPAVGATIFLALAHGLASIGYASGDIFPALGQPSALLRLTACMTLIAVVGFWFAAPYGITAVAAVHLAFQVLFGLARLRAANRLLGSTWGQSARAMGPAVVSVAGIVTLALPVSLLLPRTGLALVATVASGLLGSGLALVLFARPVLRDVLALLRLGMRR